MWLAESLLKLDGARLPHTLGTAEEHGSAPMRTALRCRQGNSFEERLQPRPIVKGVLACGTFESLGLRELPLVL